MMVRRSPAYPDLTIENEWSLTWSVVHIAGIDEAGRGALAGPVVAGAVILPRSEPRLLEDLKKVNDSKLLTANIREQLFPLVCEKAITYGLGLVPPAVIDAIGILEATRQAMIAAVNQLSPKAEALLIDGRIHLAGLHLPQQGLIRGDQLSLSVAAASILAKVSRDRYMIELDRQFPGYGFARHKGYGTVEHQKALDRLGACPEHRLSFAPLRTNLL